MRIKGWVWEGAKEQPRPCSRYPTGSTAPHPVVMIFTIRAYLTKYAQEPEGSRRDGPLSAPRDLCSRAQGGGERGCGGHGEAQSQELRVKGTDLDNPFFRTNPNQLPPGADPGGWEEVQETQEDGLGLAQLGVQRMAVSKPIRCSHLVLGPHDCGTLLGP